MSEKELEKLKIKVNPILKKYGVIRAGIFGSYARGEAKKNSDIDFLMNFSDGTTLFDLGGLKIDLENKLKREVDLVSARAIKKEFEPYILQDLRNIYEKR